MTESLRVPTRARLKVGGQALPDGVLMRTARAWAIARADGTLVTGELPPPRWPKIPVLRVLAGLAQSLRLGLTRGGRATPRCGRRPGGAWKLWRALAGAEGAVLGLDWLLGRVRPPDWQKPVITIGLWVVAIAVFRLSAPAAQWRYHGAEHKAVTAYEQGVELSDVGAVLGCSRLHPRCGTNLIVWLACLAPVLGRLPGLVQLAAVPLTVAVVAEVLTFAARWPDSFLSRTTVAPGRVLQAWVTTREPSASEQLVGCAALRACLARHDEVVTGSRQDVVTAA